MLKFQTGTKGESIFDALDEFLKEKETPLSNILSVATDGAPALLLMIGRAPKVLSRIFKKKRCRIHSLYTVSFIFNI